MVQTLPCRVCVVAARLGAAIQARLVAVSACPHLVTVCAVRASELTSSVQQLETELKRIEGVVNSIERNRAKYPHIDDAELLRRKDAVAALRQRFTDIKGTLSSKRVTGKLDSDRKQVICGQFAFAQRTVRHRTWIRAPPACTRPHPCRRWCMCP